MNAEALSFASNTFDRVCGTAILHHLDLERALAELRRVLRPGGRAIFLEALGGNPLINWYRRRTPQMRTADEHPLIERELELMALHFDTVRIDRFGFATLAAVGFRRTPIFRPALAVLEAMDRAILSNHKLRHLAWMGLIDLR
jgi:SAM-dependent methyltransferase